MSGVLEDRRKVGAVERHIVTVAQMCAVALLLWIGITTYESSVKIATLTERLESFVDKEKLVWDSLSARVSTCEDRLKNLASRTRDCEQRVIKMQAEQNALHEKAPPN